MSSNSNQEMKFGQRRMHLARDAMQSMPLSNRLRRVFDRPVSLWWRQPLCLMLLLQRGRHLCRVGDSSLKLCPEKGKDRWIQKEIVFEVWFLLFRVLVLAGSGGIGSFAIQFIKAWGGHVTTTCSSSAASLVQDLGADVVVDYAKDNVQNTLQSLAEYDVVLDTLGDDSMTQFLKPGGTFVSITNPFLETIDEKGMLPGLLCVAKKWGKKAFQEMRTRGVNYKWAFFKPNQDALKKVAAMVESGQIKPVLQSVHALSEGTEAYQKLADGHTRGKIVIKMN
eukprot:m.27237 g.27237  ORF g.27237 m.27237 type:complete len:280 (+) comp29868_c0_seq1:344-1183(+)